MRSATIVSHSVLQSSQFWLYAQLCLWNLKSLAPTKIAGNFSRQRLDCALHSGLPMDTRFERRSSPLVIGSILHTDACRHRHGTSAQMDQAQSDQLQGPCVHKDPFCMICTWINTHQGELAALFMHAAYLPFACMAALCVAEVIESLWLHA